MITIKRNEGLMFIFCKVFEKINRKSNAFITLKDGDLYITNSFTCAALRDPKLRGLQEGNYQILLSKSEKKTYMLAIDEQLPNQEMIETRIQEVKTVLENLKIDDANTIKTNSQEEFLAACARKFLNVTTADSDTAIAKVLPSFKMAKYKKLPVVFSTEPINYTDNAKLYIIFNIKLFNDNAEQIEFED